jgi:hypothetical protein
VPPAQALLRLRIIVDEGKIQEVHQPVATKSCCFLRQFKAMWFHLWFHHVSSAYDSSLHLGNTTHVQRLDLTSLWWKAQICVGKSRKMCTQLWSSLDQFLLSPELNRLNLSLLASIPVLTSYKRAV